MIKRLFYIFFLGLIQSVSSYGQSWHDVDSGVRWGKKPILEPGVKAIVNDSIHHYLYVGGEFDSAGLVPTKNLARWDGKNWSGIGNFYDTAVFALCMYNRNLVVATFTSGTIYIVDSAGDILDSFASDGFVNALAFYKGELYAGGDFTEINGVSANAIARYDGSTWRSVDSGMQSCCGPTIWALYVWNDKLYGGGSFNMAGDSLANNIAVWNDTTWFPLGSGTNTTGTGGDNEGYIYSVGSYNNNLYIGGLFDLAGGIASKWLARWNGIKWDSVGGGVNNPVYSFMQFKNNLYIGGVFDSSGNLNTTSIASWNDIVFSNVGTGIAGSVFAMDTFNKSLFVGGLFKSAGGTQAYNIARWGPDTATGIDEFSTKLSLLVYPNPTSNQITFNCRKSIQELQIENVLGQRLLQKSFTDGLQKQMIDVSILPQGIYFYKLKMDNSQNVTGKFIKE